MHRGLGRKTSELLAVERRVAAALPSAVAPDTQPAWCGHESEQLTGAGDPRSLGWQGLACPIYTGRLLPPDDQAHMPTSGLETDKRTAANKSEK